MISKIYFQIEPNIEELVVKKEKTELPKVVKPKIEPKIESPKVVKPSPASIKVEKAKPIYDYNFDVMTCTRLTDNATVNLTAGGDNLLVANFDDDDVHKSELPNLMLAAVNLRPASTQTKKKKKKKKVKKRPAAEEAVAAPHAAPAAPAAAAAAAIAPVADAPEAAKNDYGIEYYKSGKAIGIKAKFGQKGQILQFGGKSCTKTENQLRGIGTTIVADLHAGMSVKDAKAKGQELAFA